MATYQQTASPSRSGGTDVAAWALVAVVVAVICAAAGWAIARQDTPGRDDLARTADLAGRDSFVRGQSSGYAQGANQGRRELALRTRTQVAAARQEGARAGREAGVQQGRFQAGDPDAFTSSVGLGATGAYPAAGYEDILRDGLFGEDSPGYASSTYDGYGYGSEAASTYAGASSIGNGSGDGY